MKDLRFLTVNLSGKADLKKIKAFKQFNHKKTNMGNNVVGNFLLY